MAKKIRYIRQRDQFSCGPVAIINTLKFLGCNITYKDLPLVQNLCKCKSPDGTNPENLEKALSMLGICFERKIKPSLKDIDGHIKSRGAILLNYCISMGHYSLCVGKSGTNNYTLINDLDDITISGCDSLTIKHMTEWGDREKYWCWFILPKRIDEKKVEKYLRAKKET